MPKLCSTQVQINLVAVRMTYVCIVESIRRRMSFEQYKVFAN